MDVKYLLSGNTETASNQEKSLAVDERMVDTKSVMSNKLLAAKAYADYKMGNIGVTVGMEYNNTHRHDDYISSLDNPSSSFAKLVEQHVAPFLICPAKPRLVSSLWGFVMRKPALSILKISSW